MENNNSFKEDLILSLIVSFVMVSVLIIIITIIERARYIRLLTVSIIFMIMADMLLCYWLGLISKREED